MNDLIIPLVVTVILSILSHEFGHWIACVLSKVKVNMFSIGWGPKIIKTKHFEFRLIPLTGYVEPKTPILEIEPKKSLFMVSNGVLFPLLISVIPFYVLFEQGIRGWFMVYLLLFSCLSIVGLLNFIPYGNTDGKWIYLILKKWYFNKTSDKRELP